MSATYAAVMRRSRAEVHCCTSVGKRAVAPRTLVSGDCGRHQRSRVARLSAMPSQRCIGGGSVPADLLPSLLVLCNVITPIRFE
eukprot:1999820-Pyramimonas_sp.AAC.1